MPLIIDAFPLICMTLLALNFVFRLVKARSEERYREEIRAAERDKAHRQAKRQDEMEKLRPKIKIPKSSVLDEAWYQDEVEKLKKDGKI